MYSEHSQAYIAISLDSTGALRFLAFWVAKKGGTSGWKLHFYLFLFFLVLGGVVGNVRQVLVIARTHKADPFRIPSFYLEQHSWPTLHKHAVSNPQQRGYSHNSLPQT